MNLAESLSPITRKLSEVKESTQKLGEIVKESNIPQLAIENTQTELPIENEQIHLDVLYDTSLENTLSNLKNQKGFFNIEERDNGDIIWNGFPVEKMAGNELKIFEDIYNISDNLQNVFTDTSNIPLKKLIGKDRQVYKNVLESLNFKNYKAILGETKSARYKYSKNNFKDRVNKSSLFTRRSKNHHPI